MNRPLVLGTLALALLGAGCEGSNRFQYVGSFGFTIGEPPSGDTNIIDPNAPTTTTTGDDPTPPPGSDVTPTPAPICDPLGGGNPGASSENGLIATLAYMRPVPSYAFNVGDFTPGMLNITQVLNPVYLNSVSKPTSYFTEGFSDSDGNLLKDLDDSPLIEYFALFMKSEIRLASGDAEGDYQFAIISDDGAVMNVQPSGQAAWSTLVDNDGTHSNRVACASSRINMQSGQRLPVEIGWDQGPRTQISMMLFWRTGSDLNTTEPWCGQSKDNQFFFLNGANQPPVATSNYNAFLSRGWKLLNSNNFVLPANGTNPCN